MEHLTIRDRELVAIGAALGSNCIPCTESHVAKARQAGLSDSQIHEAVRLADALRKVPAAKALEAAQTILNDAASVTPEAAASAEQAPKPCCGA